MNRIFTRTYKLATLIALLSTSVSCKKPPKPELAADELLLTRQMQIISLLDIDKSNCDQVLAAVLEQTEQIKGQLKKMNSDAREVTRKLPEPERAARKALLKKMKRDFLSEERSTKISLFRNECRSQFKEITRALKVFKWTGNLGVVVGDPRDAMMYYVEQVLQSFNANQGKENCDKAITEIESLVDRNKEQFAQIKKDHLELRKDMSDEEKDNYDTELKKKAEFMVKEYMKVMIAFVKNCPKQAQRLGQLLKVMDMMPK